MRNAGFISIERLSKRYLLSHRRNGEGLRHLLEDAVRFRKGKEGRGAREEFWALRDLSAEIQPGEVVGILGRNGAGKTTLLKILSRITEPTSGTVRLLGRVASLLEVGTGFHPELTGRENIFLNGAILGMKRAEIRRKFDEIVAFAEIERFLDTPVKRYSSGMYVRLAFSVAAHLEPEILLVDEVLAVGDARFQKKCLGKMSEVSSREGRTVLFVSHNLAAIRSLCQRALYLEEGRLVLDASPAECIRRYLDEKFVDGEVWTQPPNQNPLQVRSVRIQAGNGQAPNTVEASEPFVVELEYEVRQPLANALVEFWVLASDGTHLMTFGETDANPELLQSRRPGRYRTRVQVPGNLLNTGSYYIRINSGIAHQSTFDHCDALRFEVTEREPAAGRQNRRGYIVPLLRWNTVPIADEPVHP